MTQQLVAETQLSCARWRHCNIADGYAVVLYGISVGADEYARQARWQGLKQASIHVGFQPGHRGANGETVMNLRYAAAPRAVGNALYVINASSDETISNGCGDQHRRAAATNAWTGRPRLGSGHQQHGIEEATAH